MSKNSSDSSPNYFEYFLSSIEHPKAIATVKLFPICQIPITHSKSKLIPNEKSTLIDDENQHLFLNQIVFYRLNRYYFENTLKEGKDRLLSKLNEDINILKLGSKLSKQVTKERDQSELLIVQKKINNYSQYLKTDLNLLKRESNTGINPYLIPAEEFIQFQPCPSNHRSQSVFNDESFVNLTSSIFTKEIVNRVKYRDIFERYKNKSKDEIDRIIWSIQITKLSEWAYNTYFAILFLSLGLKLNQSKEESSKIICLNCRWCSSPILKMFPLKGRPPTFCSYACSNLSNKFTNKIITKGSNVHKLTNSEAENLRKLKKRGFEIGTINSTLDDFLNHNPQLPAFRPEEKDDLFSISTARIFRLIEQKIAYRVWESSQPQEECFLNPVGKVSAQYENQEIKVQGNDVVKDFPASFTLKAFNS